MVLTTLVFSLFTYSFALLIPLLLSTLLSECLLSSALETFWFTLISALAVSLALDSLLVLICTSTLALLCCTVASACALFTPKVSENNKATLPKRKYSLFFCNINTPYD